MSDLVVVTYSFANGPGNTADADQVNTNFDDITNWLNARFGNATSGQIWVASAAGVATPRTIGGAFTLNASGVATLSSNVVGEEEITPSLAQTLGVTEASTTRRDTAVVATSETTTSTSYVDLATPGPSITLNVPTDGVVLLFFKADMKQSGGANAYIDLREDGTSLTGDQCVLSSNAATFETRYSASMADISGTIASGVGGSPGTSIKANGGFVAFQTAAGSHTYKLVYKKASGTDATFQNRRLLGLAVGF